MIYKTNNPIKDASKYLYKESLEMENYESWVFDECSCGRCGKPVRQGVLVDSRFYFCNDCVSNYYWKYGEEADGLACDECGDDEAEMYYFPEIGVCVCENHLETVDDVMLQNEFFERRVCYG